MTAFSILQDLSKMWGARGTFYDVPCPCMQFPRLAKSLHAISKAF